MIQTHILVPVADNNGNPFLREDWQALEERLFDFVTGWTELPECDGVWKGQDGRVYHDRTRRFEIALSSWREVCAFVELVDWVRMRFRQEAIYVTVAGVPEVMSQPP